MKLREELKNKIISLCSLTSVSGFESACEDELASLIGEGFDEHYKDRVGNHVFVKRCGKANATRILVDAHYDEIGMMVTEVCDGGFLKFTNIGGIDRAILAASDVVVHGSENIDGVIASTPPHLRQGESGELPEIKDMIIDTGMDKEYLLKVAPVGTPVTFRKRYTELLGGQIAGASFDNKACAAAAVYGIERAERERLAGDVYLVLSSYEETSHMGGISPAAFDINPHYAMVVDVNLADCPAAPKRETVTLGEGVSISKSAATDKRLTEATERLCKDKDIAFSVIAAALSTGTNAASLNIIRAGVPVVDIGLPLKNMHTYNEVISLDDALTLRRLVEEFVCSHELAEEFGRDVELFGEEVSYGK